MYYVTSGMTAAGVKHLPLPSGTRGSSNVIVGSYYSAGEADLGPWLTVYLTTSIRGHATDLYS